MKSGLIAGSVAAAAPYAARPNLSPALRFRSGHRETAELLRNLTYAPIALAAIAGHSAKRSADENPAPLKRDFIFGRGRPACSVPRSTLISCRSGSDREE